MTAEARRFGYDHKTGIELPFEFPSPHVASPKWKLAAKDGQWQNGDTANMSIGQGYTLVTPLHVACMMASFARGETETKPTLLHDPNRATQHTEPIGLAPADYAAIVKGLQTCYEFGTARLAKVPGLSGAAKTGTAQKGKIDLAWMVAYAPLEIPRLPSPWSWRARRASTTTGPSTPAPSSRPSLPPGRRSRNARRPRRR